MIDPRRVPWWCWWILLVWAVSFPWAGFTPVPQWNRVHWIPFTDPADKLRDIAANIALFVPFGYSLGGSLTRTARSRSLVLAAVLVVSAAVSISAEATQLFSVLRYPSATDATSAIVGGVAAAWWRLHTEKSDSPLQTI